jgi:carbon monoxide dehydrogenase subunit G
LQTSGEFTVAVDRERAFAFIGDPFRIAGCIPGCENLRETEPGKYAATLSNKVGPIAVKFDVAVELTKIEPPEAIDATVSGNAPGLGGRLTATAQLRLEALDAASTRVTYAVEMGLSGRLGGIGQPVFRAKSDELSKKFGANVRAAIEADARTAPL